MSFREKMAWAMTAVLTVGGVWYFNKVIGVSKALEATAPPMPSFVIGYVILIVVATIILAIVFSATKPEEAEAPVDERERAIEHRAGHISGVLLAVGVFVGMLNFMVRSDGNLFFHIIFGSLMVSQIAEYVLQIWFYRRGV